MVNYKLLAFKKYVSQNSPYFTLKTLSRKKKSNLQKLSRMVVAWAWKVGKMWRCWIPGTNFQL